MVLLAAGAFVLLAAAGCVFPRWLTFLLTMAAGNGLVSLGIVALMRGGVVPFGQGMVFAAGGYTAALLSNKLGFTDALGLALCGGVAAVLVAAPFAPLLVALPRHLLRDADAGAVDGDLRPADEARRARRLRRLQRRPADAARPKLPDDARRLHALRC